MFTLDEYWLTFLIATALPAVVALVTRRLASSSTKAIVLALLAAVTGWLTSLQATGGEFEVKAAVVSIIVTFVTAVASHYGLLKPTGVTGSNGAVAKKVPGGIGH